MSYIANRSIHPVVEHHPNGRLMHGGYSPGMTLRQHYAGLALPTAIDIVDRSSIYKGVPYKDARAAVARICVEMADALIAELEKPAPCPL